MERVRMVAAAVLVLVAGCSSADEPRMPFACTEDEQAVVRALAAAPKAVRLPDGTPLSTCVERARRDAELQTLATVFTRVAERLAEPAAAGDRASATQVGYLAGAVQAGARRTQGIQSELSRRIERAAFELADADQAIEDAYYAGRRAGERSG